MVLVATGLPMCALGAESAPEPPRHDFRARTDQDLTVLAAQWDELDTHERRALLTEMKLRMARSGEHGPVLGIRTERRYGRIIRQPDGRVIRIETNVVRVQRVTPEMLARVAGQTGFGVGFERRVAGQDQSDALAQAPAAESPSPPAAMAPPPMPVLKASDDAP